MENENVGFNVRQEMSKWGGGGQKRKLDREMGKIIETETAGNEAMG